MRRVRRLPAVAGSVLVALSLVLVFPAAVSAETIYVAELTGDQEVPGPGDPDGLGYAELRIDPAGGLVCAFISVEEIAEPTAAHIHAGTEGAFGDVVVTLPTPTGGEVDDCVDGLDEATLQQIVDDPGAYYVNVHNADFQAGAIRGQLGAIDVGLVTVVKLVCPPEIQSPEDLDNGGAATCAIAVTEPVDPPAGHTWEIEPFVFPELAISLEDDLGGLTLDDAVPADGGSTCGATTCSFGAGAWTWETVVDGQVDIVQESAPDGYSFEWAEVISSTEGIDPPPQEVFGDGVSFDFDTVTYADGVVVRLYDFAAGAADPARLFVEKFACPAGIDTPADLEAAGPEACAPVAGPGRVPPPPADHVYDPEPLVFDMQLQVIAAGEAFDLGDAGIGGDGFCDGGTMTCTANASYEFTEIPAGSTSVTETTFPDGYRFGWAVLTELDGDPLSVVVDADTAEAQFTTLSGQTVVLAIYDIVGVQPTPAPTVTPPPTATSAGPILSVDLAPILVVLVGATGLIAVAVRRRPVVRR